MPADLQLSFRNVLQNLLHCVALKYVLLSSHCHLFYEYKFGGTEEFPLQAHAAEYFPVPWWDEAKAP